MFAKQSLRQPFSLPPIGSKGASSGTQSRTRPCFEGKINVRKLKLRAPLSLQQIVGTVVFWGVLQPLGFISCLSAKAELALKFISRTVMEGEAGKQL